MTWIEYKGISQFFPTLFFFFCFTSWLISIIEEDFRYACCEFQAWSRNESDSYFKAPLHFQKPIFNSHGNLPGFLATDAALLWDLCDKNIPKRIRYQIELNRTAWRKRGFYIQRIPLHFPHQLLYFHRHRFDSLHNPVYKRPGNVLHINAPPDPPFQKAALLFFL